MFHKLTNIAVLCTILYFMQDCLLIECVTSINVCTYARIAHVSPVTLTLTR